MLLNGSQGAGVEELPASAGTVHTEVRPHPERSGWAVWVLAIGQLGNVLYISHQTFMLRESAEVWMRDVVDARLDSAFKGKRATLVMEDPFEIVEGLGLFQRMPTQWGPKQFDD